MAGVIKEYEKALHFGEFRSGFGRSFPEAVIRKRASANHPEFI
jgi:hypothetical protein